MAINQNSNFIPSNQPKASLFKSAPAGFEQLSNQTGQQQGLNSLLGNLSQGALGNFNLPGSNNGMSSFQPLAQQAQRNFQTQTVPGLAERFTSMGGGQLGSAAFSNQLGQAGAGLQSDLAGQEQGFNMQQEQMQNQNLMQLLQMFLRPQFENIGHGQKNSGGAQIASEVIPVLTQMLQAYLGGM